MPFGARASRPHSAFKGWHSRGYLPHCDAPGLIQSVTFRLADSLPLDVLKRIFAEESKDFSRREKIENFLDSGHGSCWLAQGELAGLVENALFHFDRERYRLLAWCVMPNHVHALVEIFQGHSLGDIVHSWKSFTAKGINRVLRRSGLVWEADYFDRYVRDDLQLRATIDYIENNPLKAGLVASKEGWPFSSAFKDAGGTPALPNRKRYTEAQ